MKFLILFFALCLPLFAAPPSAVQQIRNGPSTPSNALGNNGDYYLNTTTADFLFKQNGIYVKIMNLRGPQGIQGQTGEPGTPGSNVPDPTGHDHEFLVVLNGALAYSKNAPPAPSISYASEVSAGHVASFTVNTIGAPPFVYRWLKNGVVIPGATNAALVFQQATPDDSGSYTCTVTNGVGATTTPPATLSVVTPPAQ